MLMLKWMLGGVLILTAASAQTSWNANEASLLLPLPQTRENPLWQPATQGAHGELLPSRFWSQLPPIMATLSTGTLYQKRLRVVALRIDPCFVEGFGPQPCQRQIRLVWQPMTLDGYWTTRDAAFHTFYTLSSDEWSVFLQNWEKLRTQFPLDPALPLQVHPLLFQQGYEGPYWSAMSAVILKEIGEARLTRITAMTVNPHQNVWRFTGFNIVNRELQRMAIPGISTPVQGVQSEDSDVSELHLQLMPAPSAPGNTAFTDLIANSRTAPTRLAGDQIAKGVQRALAIENPRLNNPGTMDCASCHAAQAVPGWAARKFPQWSFPEMFAIENFAPEVDPKEGGYPWKASVLRAFGYFGTDPVISRRVMFETATVIQQFQRD